MKIKDNNPEVIPMKKYIVLLIPSLILALFVWNPFQSDFVLSDFSVDDISAKESAAVVVLDAGHGGYDAGGIAYDGTYEKDITLAITLQVGEILKNNGYEVIYTRESDTVSWNEDNLEDLKERVNIATLAQGDLFVSIHTNSSEAYHDGAYGVEAYYDGIDETMEALCGKVLDNLSDLQYTNNRGIKSTFDTPLYVIDKNNIPAALFEIGFLSDSDDAAYMTSAKGQAKIAEAIADGIMETV